MIRVLMTIKRSTVAAPAKLFHCNGLSDFTKLRPLARNFNTYPQPFPYYGWQVNSCQYDPYQRYYANRNAYQFNTNFAHFHPGVYGPHPRFEYQFRGDFSPYPVGGDWRSFGPEYPCQQFPPVSSFGPEYPHPRFCGWQQFPPVNYGGNYWGADVRHLHWVNGDARWNVQPQINMDYCGNMVENLSGFQPIFYDDWNLSADFYPYRPDIHYFCTGGSEDLQEREQPVNPDWICRQYPQTWEHDGAHWNDAAARQNHQLQGVYGLHGHDQMARPQMTMDYKYNTVTESGNLERHDVRFQRHEFANSSTASQPKSTMSYVGDQYVNPNVEQSPQSLSSTPSGSNRVLQGNGSGHLSAVHEGYKQSRDESKLRNVNYQPQIYTSEQSNSLTEHGCTFNDRPVAGGPHYARNSSFSNGRVHSRPEVENNNYVNLGHKANIDGDRWRDAKDQPEKFTVKEQPANMTDKRGNLHQSPETCHQASNETVTDSQRHLGVRIIERKEKQQPRDNSNRYTQKIDRNRHPAQNQNSNRSEAHLNVPSPTPTLSEEHPNEVSQVLNCERPVENLSREQIRSTAEELESYTKDGNLKLAVEVLDVMEKKNERLDPERDMSKVKMLIQACGDSKAVTEAKAVHKHIVNLMSPLKFSLYNKILDMYLKCGAVADACSMFYSMSAHNLTSWDTMIKGLVRNNLAKEALDVFAEFKNTESEPDGPMFLGVFSACRHVGDVTEGMLHFESMTTHYGITPSMKHYISIVDMMGHVGHLEEAMEFIEKMPVEPSVDVWETMMNVCNIHGNTELGDRCAEVVQELYPTRVPEELKACLVPLTGSNLETDKVGNGNRPGHENSKAFQQILNISHGNFLNGNPIGGQYEKRFNVASNGEASRIFQDNKGAKEDGVIAWDDDESLNGSDLGNLYDPLPDFTANEPLNPSKTNAQMPNINDTGNSGRCPSHTKVHDSIDGTHMSIDASRRCRRIIDLLESEDK